MTLITVKSDTPDTQNVYEETLIDDQKTVQDLKNSLKTIYSFENSNTNLFYNSKLLEKTRSLFSYNIQNDSIVNIVFRVR